MVSGPFYIYGGGRWREINLDDATIEGWGRAKFAYAKDGKLVLTKNSGVLAALRNLKSGYKSAARDGARLPHKHRNVTRKRGERKKYLDNSKCDCSHCCHQSNTHRGHNLTVEQSEVKQTTVTVTQSVQRIDTAIQTSPQSSVCDISDTVKKKIHKKHNKCSHSHNNEPTKKSTTAMVNSTPKKLASLKLKKQWSLVDSDKVWPKKKLPIIKLNKEDSTKYNLYKRMGDNNEEVWVVLPKTHDKDGKITNKRYDNDSASSKSSQDSLPQITKKAKTLKGIVSSSKMNCVEKNNRNPPKIQKSNNESNDNDPVSKFQLDSRPISNLEKEYLASQNKIKELVIDEDDIMMLRDFLMKNATDFNLLKFDDDLDYRTQFLFAINPVVSLERCPEINRMLRRDSQSEISLKDFASQLGLTSISEKNSPKRYKMRKRNSHEDTNISENDINKEMKKKNKKYFEETERDSDVVKDKRSLNKKSNDSGRAQDSRTPVRRKRRRTESQILSDFEEKKVADSLNLRSRANNNVTTPINFKTNDIYLSEETTTTTSEEDYSNRDSTTDEIVNARVFRKRNTEKIDKVNLITSDSADSIGITESEHLNKNLTKTTTELNVDIKKKETNTENKLTKINNCAGTNDSKQTDNYTVSKDKNVKITMTPLKRNKRGRFIKRRNTTRTENNNEENHYSKEDLNTGDKSKSNNSDEQFATNKDSRSTRKIHLLNEKSESKSKPKNNINGVENNINDRSNSMTNTNDDSESENYELKSDSRMKNVQNKLQNEKTNNNETKCHTSESDGFIRPVIGEIRSLAVEVRRDEERPPSSAASLRVEYSNLEDQAIVAWVSVGGRARAVNGNVIWKELQESYYKIAGQHRTWHSLRNRYLRSILPRLGQLALDPGQESRLRAAAHTGVFKGQKLESRRNSIFGPPPAAGALSRPRPRRSTTRSPTSEEERPPKRLKPEHTHALHSPPRRELRSSHSSPNKVERTPRFSEIIRRFADKLDTSDSTVRSSLRQSSQHREQRNSPQRNGTSDSESSHENLLKVRKSKILETRNMSKNLSKSRNSSKNLSKSGNLSDTRNSSKNLSETRNSSKDASSLSEKKTSKKSLPAKEPATRSHKKGGNTARKLFNPNSGRKL